MSFPKLTFPLTIDCASTEYWIGEEGPFAFGEATTYFFCGGIETDEQYDREALLNELESCLQAFGTHLNSYIQPPQLSRDKFEEAVSSSAAMTISYRCRVRPGAITFVRGFTFSSLRDFLYTDLCNALMVGSGPRRCRLCGQWFFHKHGDKNVYCDRIAPSEESKTCREAGARAVFEKKLQEDDAWKLYKRAYKKYYARVMKGNMSREEFNAWVEFAASQRDTTLLLLEGTKSPEEKAGLIERLREELNRA